MAAEKCPAIKTWEQEAAEEQSASPMRLVLCCFRLPKRAGPRPKKTVFFLLLSLSSCGTLLDNICPPESQLRFAIPREDVFLAKKLAGRRVTDPEAARRNRVAGIEKNNTV